MTAFVPSEIFHADDYGVSPYDLDRRLCELLEKQQEETISELEEELKSTKNELHDKEIELQHWKEHVSRLLELSFVTNSGICSLTHLLLHRWNYVNCKSHMEYSCLLVCIYLHTDPQEVASCTGLEASLFVADSYFI